MSTPKRTKPLILADVTEARLTVGPRKPAPDTATSLRFSLDHARARDAVLSEMDVESVRTQLATAGLESRTVTSAAGGRDTFIRRPDLGRQLPAADAKGLHDMGPVDVALVLGDGLSAVAVALNGAAFMGALATRLLARGLAISPVICARQARVGLGDKIAVALGAQSVVIALGERPGLSAADSLGVYVTHRPTPTTQDSARNCISNIREAGTGVIDAADQAEQLIVAMRETGLSGVALSQARAARPLPNPPPT